MGLGEVADSALEVGCGNWGLWRFNKRVTGLDPLDFSAMGENFVQGKAESIPFPDYSFSDVFCVNALDHCENPRLAMREMARVASSRVVLWCYVFDEALRPFFRIAYAPHPHCFTEMDLLGLIPRSMVVEKRIVVSPMNMFDKYAKSPVSRVKLHLAEALGVHALLLHMRKSNYA